MERCNPKSTVKPLGIEVIIFQVYISGMLERIISNSLSRGAEILNARSSTGTARVHKTDVFSQRLSKKFHRAAS